MECAESVGSHRVGAHDAADRDAAIQSAAAQLVEADVDVDHTAEAAKHDERIDGSAAAVVDYVHAVEDDYGGDGEEGRKDSVDDSVEERNDAGGGGERKSAGNAD